MGKFTKSLLLAVLVVVSFGVSHQMANARVVLPLDGTCPSDSPIRTQVDSSLVCLSLAEYCPTNPQWFMDYDSPLKCPDYQNNPSWISYVATSTTAPSSSATTTTAAPSSGGSSSSATTTTAVQTSTTSTSSTTTTTLAPVRSGDTIEYGSDTNCPTSHPIKTQVNSKIVCYTLAAYCASQNPTYYDSARGLYCPGVTTTSSTSTSSTSTSSTTTTTLAPVRSGDTIEYGSDTNCPTSHPIKTQVNSKIVCYTLAAYCASQNPTYYDSARGLYCPLSTTTTTSTTSPSPITVEPTTTSSSAPKSGNTDTAEVGSNDASSESSSSGSSVSSAATTTTTAVPNGEVRTSVGGVEVKSETTVTEGAVSVSVGEVTAEIANAEESEDSTNTKAEQGLVLSSGESADVSIDGLQPNSEVEVVIYSTPRKLGSLQVNEFGELVASIQIPSDMESGPHTLVLTGFDKFGKQIELKFGLVVYSPDAYIPVWVWFIIGLLLILLSASLVSRKNKKVIIAT